MNLVKDFIYQNIYGVNTVEIASTVKVKKPMRKMQRNLFMKNLASLIGGTINTQTSGHLLMELMKKHLK